MAGQWSSVLASISVAPGRSRPTAARLPATDEYDRIENCGLLAISFGFEVVGQDVSLLVFCGAVPHCPVAVRPTSTWAPATVTFDCSRLRRLGSNRGFWSLQPTRRRPTHPLVSHSDTTRGQVAGRSTAFVGYPRFHGKPAYSICSAAQLFWDRLHGVMWCPMDPSPTSQGYRQRLREAVVA